MIDLKRVKDFTQYSFDNGDGSFATKTSEYHTWIAVLRLNDGYINDDAGNRVCAELISHTGGYEEDEEECTSILMIGDQYFKFDYGYRSSEGYDFAWMDVREVKQVRKMVTVYE